MVIRPCFFFFYLLGVQISVEGFFGGPSFVNPSQLICTPNIQIARGNYNIH